MSSLVVLKDNNVLVLGTDSRAIKQDGSGVASDSVQKIHEIAPHTFISASGWTNARVFEEKKARELAGAMATTDVRRISDALRREFLPYLRELVEASYSVEGLHTFGGSAVCGNVPVHCSLLVGRDGRGRLGFIIEEYGLRDGELMSQSTEYFRADRRMWVRPGVEPVQQLAQDPRTWSDSPVVVVKRFLATINAAEPLCGGPDQIIEIDRDGAHWISQLSEPAAVVVDTAHASVSVGDGGFTFTGTGGITIATGAGISVSPGMIFGATIRAGSGGYQLTGGTQVIDNTATFVGAAVNVSGGCGANGFNPKSGGTQYYGATFSFQDNAGVTHQVIGGVIVS